MSIKPIFAVCVLIQDKDKFLSVTRHQNPNDLGLPGGKVEPGEDPRDAIKREVQEETGLVLNNFIEVYDGVCGEDRVITYLAVDWEGSIFTEEDHEVKWVKIEDLLTEECTFKQYNFSLFEKVANAPKVEPKWVKSVKLGCDVLGIVTAFILLTFWQYFLIGIMLAVADSFRIGNNDNKWLADKVRIDIKKNEALKEIDFKDKEINKIVFISILISNLYNLGLFWPGELLFILLRILIPKLDRAHQGQY